MSSGLKMFTSHKIGYLKIKNRIVRSATYMGTADREGNVTENTITLYEELAKNEVGLIISGYMYVNKKGKAAPNQLGIYDDKVIPSLKRLISKIHDHEAILFAQIAHGGRQIIGSPQKKLDIIAPSPIPDKLLKVKPREMTKDDIKNVIQDFISATTRIYQAGLDGVQLHCAHGYLLSLFISPYCNKRSDAYGGNLENRFRILEEIVTGIQDEIGKEFPITVKINVADFVKEDPQLTIDESKILAKKLANLGVAAIEPSAGLYETAMNGNLTAMRTKIRTESDEAYFLPEAKIIKKEIGNVPVILVGGIRSKGVAERILNNGIDFISLSRPLIREPDLITKWKNGTSTKADCISCARCLLSASPKGVQCIPLKKILLKQKSN
ncbi:MAG: NADH:flavin oxidoreductase [Candidatus Lokiarchaeota archaeon]|nr:NADH:flavin oxidoreductase [Candidatus Lokiarchaeota archaeon]